MLARLSTRKCGAEGIPSVNSAYEFAKADSESASVDPKPGDLPMSRMKLP